VNEAKSAVRIVTGGLPASIRLHFDGPEGLPAIEADSSQLHQVLLNLLTNASEAVATQPSGVIRVSVAQVSMPSQGLQCHSPHAPDAGEPVVEITVQDSGMGFSPDAMSHLFEPFFTTKTEGHGIGLAAVRSIILNQGAALSVANDNGAIIRCYFPISTRPEVLFDETLASGGGKDQMIWVVDDQTALLEYVKISLRSHGYQVHGFHSQNSFQKHIRRNKRSAAPDLLLLDVMMPEGSGHDLLTHIREQSIECPVIWMSGFDPGNGVQQPMESSEFLQKPFTHSELLGVVQEVLTR
jgi:CheY-like chemotaxis protein